MQDEAIIELYWQREEQAVAQTDRKYGALCRGVARRILTSREDAEECVSDAYLAAWQRIPPERPEHLAAYVAGITRHLSLNRLRERNTQKRGGGELSLALDELAEALPGAGSVEREVEARELAREIERFLAALSADERAVFLGRYWLLEPVAELARRLGFSQSKVKTTLWRTRQRLQAHLTKEGLL